MWIQSLTSTLTTLPRSAGATARCPAMPRVTKPRGLCHTTISSGARVPRTVSKTQRNPILPCPALPSMTAMAAPYCFFEGLLMHVVSRRIIPKSVLSIEKVVAMAHGLPCVDCVDGRPPPYVQLTKFCLTKLMLVLVG